MLTTDYCDVFLTHDSTSVRKAHNCGRNHLQNVRDYYASLPPAEIQGVVDTLMKDYQNRGHAPPMELVGLYGRPVRPPVTRPPPSLPPGVNLSVPPPSMNRPPPFMGVPPPNMNRPPPNFPPPSSASTRP
ncbi:U1 small nuclear ribonucleoprotein C [Malassezia yamatoensis]|uniref:U1 small nuclear ribonucleoprotein C n=1 Tax=Malassezia yamatoensis TaxID=253288 RepID=A0AAJ6CHL2_9BASI|nr:U1 small nuclear ribonucleoprotein C [Malassezia yamatoensis]